MIVLEKIRKIIFWTMDFLGGSRVRRNFREIRLSQEDYFSDSAIQNRAANLNTLLSHALDTVPFYKNSNGAATDLKSFPIINKTIIRENFDAFGSSKFKDADIHKVTTSGSTGTPFTILQDKGKRDRNAADTIYFGKKAGYEIGYKLCYLRLWDEQYLKSNIVSKAQNISMVSVDNLNDKRIAKLIGDIREDRSTIGILGYSSAVQSICKYLDSIESQPIGGNVKSVITIAEELNDYTRESVKKYFNVLPLSRYSNSENGILAQEYWEDGKRYFEINWSSYYIEILDLYKDIPVKNGEIGRIVVTDFFNYSMPMIRYDTGDVGAVEMDDKGKLYFSKIEGRKMDIFTNTKGEHLSSHLIHLILEHKEVEQFQFIQETPTEYIIKIKLLDPLSPVDERKVVGQYKKYFGEDAVIKVEFVKDIPALNSGKRKLVINKTLNF